MTLPATPRRAGPFTGNGVTTAFPFTFKVFAAADVAVTVADSAGVQTTLVLDAHYSVTLNGDQDTSPGGTITYPISGSALPVGSVLAAVGVTSYTQALALPSGGNFSPRALENQLDRATMQIQQLKEEVDRSAKMPVTQSAENIEAFTAGVVALADNTDDIALLAANIGSIVTVAEDINEPVSEINAVAGAIDNVNTVGGAISAVNLLANDLAGTGYDYDLGSITTPSTGASTSPTSAIIAVAGVVDDLPAIAALADEITAVAAVASGVDAVATNITDVLTVATNITDVSNFADVYQGAKTEAPSLRNDGSALHEGDLYFNTSVPMMWVYSAGGWAASVSPNSVTITPQSFNGNGSATTFTLSPAPAFPAACDVYLSGIAQRITVDFTVVGATLTFAVAPPAGTGNIYVKVLASYSGDVPPDGSITSAKLASTLDLGAL